MNYDIFQLLVIVVAVIVAAQLTLGVWLMVQSRKYRGLARTERIRLQIGDARCRW